MRKIITFDEVQTDGTINLGIGQPSADLLPLDIIESASEHFFKDAAPQDINYGPTKGDERFLHSIANFLTKQYGKQANVESLFVTGGNSQALDFVCSMFSNTGDTIFVEEPSYFLALNIFRDNHLNIIGIPTDESGIDIDFLEAKLKKAKPALVYTIPVYHNPNGQTLSAERRERLVELSKEYGFLIIADEVYQMLNYYEQPPEAFGTMIDSNTVLSLGSFSKILAPGMRLGWIQTSQQLIGRLNRSGFINSGGCVNQFASNIVRFAIDLGLLDTHLEMVRTVYRSRLEKMDAALTEAFGDNATWICPEGGYFFWIKFDENVDAGKLKRIAIEHKTGFQAGELFSSCGGLKNYIRLSFARYNESEIREGIVQLKEVFGL
jgi:DNA-binding transcriptional MocR family regulator